MRLLFRQALADGALAFHLFRDDEDDCYRMCYCLADVWYEMTPPPPGAARQALTQLRKKSRINGSRQEGELRYMRNGKALLAHCVSPSPDTLCVYFTDHRPTPLNKKAGDKPGPRDSD